MGFTLKDIQHLQQRAKIRGYIMTPVKRKGNTPVASKASAQKEWLELNLQYWCNDKCVNLERELKFTRDRKFRFDWAIPAYKIAVEYEGIFSAKSRHTTNSGFTNDTEKYNRAAAEGWKVLRFTANNYKNLVNELNRCIHE